MRKLNPASDAAAVFQEAKLLVAEVRQSRQRSPVHRFSALAEGTDTSYRNDTKRENDIPNYIPDMASIFSGADRQQAGTNTFPDSWCQGGHDDVCLSESLGLPLVHKQNTNWKSAPETVYQDGLSTALQRIQLQHHDVASLHDGPKTPFSAADLDPETSGDDQPSRWQLLVRRVNAEAAAAETGGSPLKSARSPSSQNQTCRTATSPLVHCTDDLCARSIADGAANALDSGIGRVPVLAAEGGGSVAARHGSAGRRHMSGPFGAVNTFTSPYERALAALQQAEQQLYEHKQQRVGGSVTTSPAASPAGATLAAGQRFLATVSHLEHNVIRAAKPLQGNANAASRFRSVYDPCDTVEGTFEEIAQGLVHRIASSVRLGMDPPGASGAPTGLLSHSYAVLEPPPAQHIAAVAALAAASTATFGTASGGGAGIGAMTTSAPAAPELELRIAMQGLMSAVRQASSEEALKLEQERRQREAEAVAEAAITAVEERAVRLARLVLYLRLWGMAAKWSRRESEDLAAMLRGWRMRRCFIFWSDAARVARTERLAIEAVELAEEAHRDQVALRFRRLWMLHHALKNWRLVAAARAEDRRRLAARTVELSLEQQAEALREATANRFHRLWLLHSHMRTWRAAARAQATARLVAGGVGPGRDSRAGGGATADAAVAPSGGGLGQERQQHQRRTVAVAALLNRLRCQREAFRVTIGGSDPSAAAMDSSCRQPEALKWGPDGYESQDAVSIHGGAVARAPSSSAPAPKTANATNTSPAAASRLFPGLNKWIRPAVMRGRRDADGGNPVDGVRQHASAAKGPATAAVPPPGGTRVTKPVPFQLSTSARAHYRRNQVLAACEATRHMVTPVTDARITTDPWATELISATGTSSQTAIRYAIVRTSSGTRSSGNSGADTNGDGGKGRRSTDTALYALQQVVRRRHQPHVAEVATGCRGSSDGAMGSAGFCDTGEAPNQLQSGLGGQQGAAGCRGPSLYDPSLDLSSVSSVWSSGGKSSAEAAGVEKTGEQEEQEEEDGDYDESRVTQKGHRGGCSEVNGVGSRAGGHRGNGLGNERATAMAVAADGVDSSLSCVDRLPASMCGREGSPVPRPLTTSPRSTLQRLCAQGTAQDCNQREHDQVSQQHRTPLDPPPPFDRSSFRAQTTFSSSSSLRQIPAALGRRNTSRATSSDGSSSTTAATASSVGKPPIPSNTVTPAAAAGGWPSGFTVADLERLRAAEVRRRRQADEQARRLALELAAHMEQLAVVHRRRALLRWHGMAPWLEVVARAQREARLADQHFATGLLRRAILALTRTAVRARVRAVSRVAAAVAVGRRRHQECLARIVLGRLSAWARSAALSRRHMCQRVLLSLMRTTREGWAARADAAEHWQRRRLWNCFHAWKVAAERQASEELLWELQRQREVEMVLGHRSTRRVLAEWRRLAQEAAEQRASLQHRSQQWSKVQGWLAEVQMARERGRSTGACGKHVAEATATAQRNLYDWHESGGDVTDSALAAPKQRVMAEGFASAESLDDVACKDTDHGGAGFSARCIRGIGGDYGVGSRKVFGAAGCMKDEDNDDDPLGLGPLEEHLQQFSLGSDCLRLQAPVSRTEALGNGPRVGGSGPRRLAWPSDAGCAPPLASLQSDCASQRWAVKRTGSFMGRPMGPPLFATRQQRLARYLEGRRADGARPLTEDDSAGNWAGDHH